VIAIANELSIDVVSFQDFTKRRDSSPLVEHWR
jgi:hypothetical protein